MSKSRMYQIRENDKKSGSGEVNVKLYDLKDSKRFYAHAFERGKFAIDKVKRCGAAKDAPVVTPDGRGKILSRRIEQTEDAMYEYYVMQWLHMQSI